MREEELVKNLKRLGKEATWCRTCLRRDKCDIKETVAMEQKISSSLSSKICRCENKM